MLVKIQNSTGLNIAVECKDYSSETAFREVLKRVFNVRGIPANFYGETVLKITEYNFVCLYDADDNEVTMTKVA